MNPNRRKFLKFLLVIGGALFFWKKFGTEAAVGATKVSHNRLDMDGKPIKNVSEIDVSNRLKIPVGVDLYN